VALTRAEKRATLTYAMSRYRYGTLNNCEPSRFIEEISANFLDMPGVVEDMYEDRGQGFGANPWGGFGNRQRSTTPGTSPASKPQPPTVPKHLKKLSNDPTPSDHAIQPAGAITAGVQVEHAKFGKGKVLNVEGAAPNEKATVFFPSIGQKQLLLKFAKLKVLG
jgi:DNA helicase-2/ATP-dependent DNA helicase PcrA